MTETVAPVAPAVASFDPVEWTKKIETLEASLVTALNHNAELLNQRDQLSGHLKRAQADASGARGELKPLRAELKDLRARFEARADLVEMKRLREEVSLGHAKYETLKREIEREREIARQCFADEKRAEARFVGLEGTATLMQRARDAAQLRESQAFQRVAELDRDLAKALQAHADLESGTKMLEEVVFKIAGAHEKGHPSPVAGCAICSALGREASPAAAE